VAQTNRSKVMQITVCAFFGSPPVSECVSGVVASFNDGISHSLTHSLTHHSLTHSLTALSLQLFLYHSPNPLHCTYSLTHSQHPITHTLTTSHPLTHSLTHSLCQLQTKKNSPTHVHYFTNLSNESSLSHSINYMSVLVTKCT
jgi:hypothetical protein